MAGLIKRRRPSRLFNRTSAYILVLAFSASALLYRSVRPYFMEREAPAARGDAAGDLAQVTRVIDGDTLEVRVEGQKERQRVRLLRIDTPERRNPGYEAATAALARLVEGKRVLLEGEGQKRDRYGRLLSYVYVDDINVNVQMVEDGWSRFETRYGRGRYAIQFIRAEKTARADERGLWTESGWNR